MKNKFMIILTLGVLFGCGDNPQPTEDGQSDSSRPEIGMLETDTVQPDAKKLSEKPENKLNESELFLNSTKILFKYRPISASSYGVPEKLTGYHYQNYLDDYSPENEAKFRAEMRQNAQKILQLVSSSKVPDENVDVVENITQYYAGDKDFAVGFIDSWMGHSPFIVNQINGPMIDVPNTLINSHTIKNIQDAKDYIQRLSQFKSMADSILAKVRSDAREKWIPPKVILKKASNYLHGFTTTPAAQSTLVQALKNKLAKLTLKENKQQQLIKEATIQIEKSVYPAFEMMAREMDQLYPQGRDESGIWAQPNGEQFYAYEIRKLGDTDLSAAEIHLLGLKEVDRITTEMDKILKAEGYSKGSVGERMVALNNEPRFLYPNTDEGRAKLLQHLNGLVNNIKIKMPAYFQTIPPYKLEIKRIPVATQDSSPGGYATSPTLDGSTPGIYWINLRNTKANPEFDLKTLTYHEAIPGHFWQGAISLAQKDLPFIRRIAPYNAYAEGWALYSERLAYEMGMYKDDPFGNLGRLKAELFRAVRLVVDTGIHYKKWTREQAIEYMAAKTGSEKADVISEIERYMNWPAQALGYKLGMLKILSLREYAKQQLGDKFDIKKFHDEVLLGGAVPMKVLDAKIRHWVEMQKKSDNPA